MDGNKIDISSQDKEDIDNGILTLSCVASHNREEGISSFHGKSILLGTKDSNIKRHKNAYEISVHFWSDFFNGTKNLKDIALSIHALLMPEETSIIRKRVGKFRNTPVFLGGKNEENEFEGASFIPPNYDKLEKGFSYLEREVHKKIESGEKKEEIAGFIHYIIAVLHPFTDGNGRVARILALSFLESFGNKKFRGFTFIAETLKKNGVLLYDISLHTQASYIFTKSLQYRGIHFSYNEDGGKYVTGLEDFGIEEYIDKLDIKTPINTFCDILSITQASEKYFDFIVHTLSIAREFSGDHKLLWVFINKLIKTIGIHINSGNFDGFHFIIDEKILQETLGILPSSVRNLDNLIEKLKEQTFINIEIKSTFYDTLKVYGLKIKGDFSEKTTQILSKTS